MSMLRRWSFLTLTFLMIVTPPAVAGDKAWFPFAMPADDASRNILDVSSLNPAPAGTNGPIRVKDGHFVDGKGQRVRFLGVNLTFGACFPSKEDAIKAAGRMRKFGINVVRLHHLDYYQAPRGLFDPRFADTQHFDAGQVDRLDHFVYQLKKHGIYVNVNLHVSRQYTVADGFPDARVPKLGKVVGFFDPRMIALQKKYARDLLTHVNPYTKTSYAEDPAIAFVEITNENSLVGGCWNGRMDNLAPTDRNELARQWNAWLKTRYTSTEGLKRAWKASAADRGPNLLRNPTFTKGMDSWRLERHQGAQAETEQPEDVKTPEGVEGKVLRVKVATPGKQAWLVQVNQAGLDFQEGQPYTVTFWARADRKRIIGIGTSLDREDWHSVGLGSQLTVDTQWRSFRLGFTASRTLKDHGRLVFALGDAAGNLDLAGFSLYRSAEGLLPEKCSLEEANLQLGRATNSPAGADWVAFLIDTELRYHTDMRPFIKKELGCQAQVICSQANFGGLGGVVRETLSDYGDMHVYWEHPNFPHRVWDPVDWKVANTPMTRHPGGGTFPALARYRLADKPFTVSEYNHPAPNEYRAECLPMLAAYAAAQDWDGLYLFDYHADRERWEENRIRGFFSVDSDPAKMALFPAAAMLFLRGDIAKVEDETRIELGEGDVVGQMLRQGADVNACWDRAGGLWPLALNNRLSIRIVPNSSARVTVKKLPAPNPEKREPALRWQGGTEKELFTANSPLSKVVVGFLGKHGTQLPGWKIDQQPNTAAGFAALALTAMDSRPLEQSRSLLLTAVGQVENQEMGWNKERTSVGNRWGAGPTRAEGISATMTVATRARLATVHALDATGKRRVRVDSHLEAGKLTFVIGPEYQTLWYEIETND